MRKQAETNSRPTRMRFHALCCDPSRCVHVYVWTHCDGNEMRFSCLALRSVTNVYVWTHRDGSQNEMRFSRVALCVVICHDASTFLYGRIVTDRKGTHAKRIRVGRGLGDIITNGEDKDAPDCDREWGRDDKPTTIPGLHNVANIYDFRSICNAKHNSPR